MPYSLFFADGELPGRDMSLLDSMTDEKRAEVIFIYMNHTSPS
jgi:hypothetical protein